MAETGDITAGPFPSSLAGSYLAGRSADRARDLSSAATYYTTALANDPDNPLLLERVLILHMANGSIDTARNYAEQLIAIDPRNPVARLLRSVDAIERGALAEAEMEAAETALTPLSVVTTGLLGAWAAFGQGKTDEALERIAELTGPSWYRVFKDYHTALIADLAGREDLAIDTITTAYRNDGGALRIVEAHARILTRAGRRDEALESLRGFLAVQPNNPVIGGLLETLESGAEPAPMVASSVDGAAEALYGLGTIIGNSDGAELPAAYLRLALHLAPNSDLALLSLGEVLVAAERCNEGIKVYDQIPAESHLRRNADIQTGFCLDILDRHDEAVERLQALVDAEPGDVSAVMALGNILRGRERFAESAKVLTTGIDTLDRIDDSHWRLFYYRGIAHERSKMWEESEADLKLALELNPDQPDVLNYLGYTWVDMGVNLEEGLAMIRLAVEQQPNNGFIVDSLGWAYYKLGRYEEAVAQLERAVELRPEDPVLNDHLGDAYWKVGRKLEATFQWSHARDLDPDPQNLEKIVQKLESGMIADGGNDG